ncbi:MAG: DUF1512 family protein [Candidatus Aenigmarchaeota archaeon]|nr:DUF1512 family protein [Candidatus Aenigmarchaeota archaeon]
MFGSTPWELINIILLVFLIFFFPRLMTYQIITLLESKAKAYDEMVVKSQRMIVKKIGLRTKLTRKEMDDSIKGMLEYFVVEPEAIEPTGLANKIRQMTNRHDKKLDIYIEEITSGVSEEERKNLSASMMHTIGIHQISKIIKHFIEIIRETKNFQYGMLLQIQLPFIDRQVKALYKSIPAFTNGIPVGDCIGPLYAATLIGDNKTTKIAEGTVVATRTINGKEVFILKAEGPAANLGNIDEAIRKIVAKNKIEKVITVDASGKLEGETTGAVARGVGFAMGPRGAERFFAESYLIEKGIPVDAVIVKMKPEEALMPMPKEVKLALPKVDLAVKQELKEVKKRAIIAGIGVTIGVGNSRKAAEEAIRVIDAFNRREEQKKKAEKKGLRERVFGRKEKKEEKTKEE